VGAILAKTDRLALFELIGLLIVALVITLRSGPNLGMLASGKGRP